MEVAKLAMYNFPFATRGDRHLAHVPIPSLAEFMLLFQSSFARLSAEKA